VVEEGPLGPDSKPPVSDEWFREVVTDLLNHQGSTGSRSTLALIEPAPSDLLAGHGHQRRMPNRSLNTFRTIALPGG
jgi:hypothetical protein